MKMINPAKVFFKIAEVPAFYPDEVTGGNDKYIDKPYSRVRQLFKNTWLIRYMRPHKVVFDKLSEF